MVYGLWSMVYGLWSMVYGLRPMVYGLWSMVYGLWPMVYVEARPRPPALARPRMMENDDDAVRFIPHHNNDPLSLGAVHSARAKRHCSDDG